MTHQEVIKKIIPILKAYGVSYAGLFGSRARGEAKEGSDFDVLVKFGEPKGLFDLVGLEEDLSKALDAEVDVVTERALHPRIKTQALRDLTPLYGER